MRPHQVPLLLLCGAVALLPALGAVVPAARAGAARPAPMAAAPEQVALVAVDGVAYAQVQVPDGSSAGGRMAVVALDAASGAERWRAELGDLAHVIPRPAVVEGAIYTGSSDALVALDAADGSRRWRFPTGDGVSAMEVINGTPSVAAGAVFATDWGGDLAVVDAATGTERWHRRFPTVGLIPLTQTVANGMVYVGNGEEGRLYALDAATGAERWRFDVERATGPFSSLVVDDVVVVGDPGGALWALDARTGDERWRVAPAGDGGHSVSPVGAGRTVYVGGHGVFRALDAASGDERWHVDTGDDAFSAATVAEGAVYVGGSGGLYYALDAATGEERWRWRFAAGDVFPPPVVAGDGVLYAADEQGALVALEAATGAERWRLEPTPEPAGWWVPAPGDGVAIVVRIVHGISGASEPAGIWLRAVDAESGAERWRWGFPVDPDCCPAAATRRPAR